MTRSDCRCHIDVVLAQLAAHIGAHALRMAGSMQEGRVARTPGTARLSTLHALASWPRGRVACMRGVRPHDELISTLKHEHIPLCLRRVAGAHACGYIHAWPEITICGQRDSQHPEGDVPLHV